MLPNTHESANLVTFTEETLNDKLRFSGSDKSGTLFNQHN